MIYGKSNFPSLLILHPTFSLSTSKTRGQKLSAVTVLGEAELVVPHVSALESSDAIHVAVQGKRSAGGMCRISTSAHLAAALDASEIVNVVSAPVQDDNGGFALSPTLLLAVFAAPLDV